jgi:hypothetical protein
MNMKVKTITIGLIVLVATSTLVLAAASGPPGNQAEENIIYAEGIGLDGLEVTPDPEFPATIVGPADNVMIDWSDNIVFHQFPVGQAVRTEVILHNIKDDMMDAPPEQPINPAVYTLTAHLKIQKISDNVGEPEGPVLYESSIAEGLFSDGPSDFYTAKINKEGNLLYGYNWDTRGLESGWYRLTFWLEKDENCPDVNPNSGSSITYYRVDITSHAPGDTDNSTGGIVGFVHDDFAKDVGWIDIYLLPKDSGRG